MPLTRREHDSSERNAEAARQRLDKSLEALAQREPELAARFRAEVAQFKDAAQQAVEAYTLDQRVIGNSEIAIARAGAPRKRC